MLTLKVKINKNIEPNHLGQRVKPSDVSQVVKPNTIIIDEMGEPLIVFGRFNSSHDQIKKYLPKVKYQNNQRITRVNQNHADTRSADISFGYKPKRPIFGLPASACLFNNQNPALYKLMTSLGQELMSLYKNNSSERYQRQINLMAHINERWRLSETFFTQGIINDTVNLNYHYDRGNISGCWSCMAVFKRGVSGGELVIPAIDCRLEIDDETYVLFDGQSLLHGVGPITKTNKFGRRFSVVFYAIALMANYGSYDDELAAIKKIEAKRHRL